VQRDSDLSLRQRYRTAKSEGDTRLARHHARVLAMLLRPGNAGSNTFAGHRDVLAAAVGQVPARFRKKILVRADGAGASHGLVKHLLND